MFSNSSYESTAKLGELANFQRGQFVGARLAGASLNKPGTFLGVSRAAVSKGYEGIANHGNT